MTSPPHILLKDLNNLITCPLCSGYFVDATKLLDCMHTFCRSCILKHFENGRVCPSCKQTCKEKRADTALQTLAYKMVPGLYSREIQRRDEFYRTAGVRASSSCSDDSVIGDNMQDHEEWIHTLGNENQFLSPDDSISLSLEYYQPHLDRTSANKSEVKKNVCEKVDGKAVKDSGDNKVNDDNKIERRYLQCPAAVQMTHLQKFLRMKFALCEEHKVDIIYEGEVLPSHFTLMDVAYTFKWRRVKPLRFFYRIFTHIKIKPIKIINTSTDGHQHHQIVSTNIPVEPKVQNGETLANKLESLEDEQKNKEKERLMSELKLQMRKKPIEEIGEKLKIPESKTEKIKTPESKTEKIKTLESKTEKIKTPESKDEKINTSELKGEKRKRESEDGNHFRYGDNEEEMKKFAEKRDREWQMLKTPDEEYRGSKKRKKNKHSKDVLHKKLPKLHAEITSEEKLKLKVKLTPHNGHKHKHHRSAQNVEKIDKVQLDMSSKEKINQLRQVRHKAVNIEDKQSKVEERKVETTGDNNKIDESQKASEPQTSAETVQKYEKENPPATKPLVLETRKIDSVQKLDVVKVGEKPAELHQRFSPKTFEKLKQPQRSEVDKKTAQSTKTLQQQISRLQQQTIRSKIETQKAKVEIPKPKVEIPKPKLDVQKAKIEIQKPKVEMQMPKLETQKPKVEVAKLKIELQKPKVDVQKPKIDKPFNQYPPGFTVSKIEQGVKRKAENDEHKLDKRPSLEITLIPQNIKPPNNVKRPPPATIPLQRIKNSLSNSGLSIIPKMPEKVPERQELAPLDLSKPHKVDNLKNGLPTQNGLKISPDKSPLSNLQMLSKVATEHPNINKSLTLNKQKPQMPNLQTIRVPTPQNIAKNPALATDKKLPKLNEINKAQFRMINTTKTVRPNQNQCIRNIPNPSRLQLVRQQNQNRLNMQSTLSIQTNQTDTDKQDGLKSNEKRIEDERKDDAEKNTPLTPAT